MSIYHITPYSNSKDIGAEYNHYMSILPDDGVAVIRDGDTMFLTPDWGSIIAGYVDRNPGVVMVCRTNRIHTLSKEQRTEDPCWFNQPSIIEHIELAKIYSSQTLFTTPVHGPLSGFLMVIPKSVWLKYPFKEDGLPGVDTDFFKRYREGGNVVLRMDGLFVFHIYRLGKDIKDTSHLK
jgi:hypothetical protein